VANLPYLPAAAYRRLAPELRLYEPRSALVGGRDGLGPTKRLIDRVAAEFMTRPDGAGHGAGTEAGRGTGRTPETHLLFELLPVQCARVAAYARKRLPGWAAERIVNAQGVAIGIALASPTPAPVPAPAGAAPGNSGAAPAA
jgi:methylase of polypeptide subunit release factors